MNKKIDSELHTVASAELQKEIDEILAKEKKKDEEQEDKQESDTKDN